MIYNYICEKCDKEIERNYKMGESPTKIKCNYCGSNCYRKFSNIYARIPSPTSEARRGRGQR